MWPSKFLPLEGQGSRKRDAEGGAPKTLYAIMADSWGSEWKWGTDTLYQGYKRGRQRSHTQRHPGPSTDPCPHQGIHTPSTNPISHFLNKTQATSLNLPEAMQPQSFLSEAQLRSPAPHKTESIQSWLLEPPLEAWRTDRAKGPTCYPLPPLPPALPGQSLPHDRHFICRVQRTSQSPLYPSPDARSTFISPTSCLV